MLLVIFVKRVSSHQPFVRNQTRPISSSQVSTGILDNLTFKQLTHMPFGFGIFEPAVTPDGLKVVFSSTYDFTSGNASHRSEVFLCDITDGSFLQLTQTPIGKSDMPLITPDGQRVIFRSSHNHNGNNPDYSEELWEVTVATGEIRQLTDISFLGGSAINRPRLSRDGRFVAFSSGRDPLGTNPQNKQQIFLLDRSNPTPILQQLTTITTTSATEAAINYDGSRVVFVSGHNFDGTNPDHSNEVWLWQPDIGISGVTSSTSPINNELPAMDNSGNLVVFKSNLSGLWEIYLADIDGNTIDQLTFAPEANLSNLLEAVISPDGTYVLFE